MDRDTLKRINEMRLARGGTLKRIDEASSQHWRDLAKRWTPKEDQPEPGPLPPVPNKEWTKLPDGRPPHAIKGYEKYCQCPACVAKREKREKKGKEESAEGSGQGLDEVSASSAKRKAAAEKFWNSDKGRKLRIKAGTYKGGGMTSYAKKLVRRGVGGRSLARASAKGPKTSKAHHSFESTED